MESEQSGERNGRARRTIRAAWRWTARGLRAVGIALAVVVLVVLVLIGTPPGRRALLNEGLKIAERKLPGQLTVASADWPTPSRVDLRDLLWTDHGDTVVVAHRFGVDLSIRGLIHHELILRELLLADFSADPDAFKRLFPPRPPVAAAQPRKQPLLRPGALPPLPSVAIGRLSLANVSIHRPGKPPVQLAELAGSLDVRAGHKPRTKLDLRAAPMPDLGVTWALDGSMDGDGLLLQTGRLELHNLRPGADIPKPAPAGSGGTLRLPLASLTALSKKDFGAVAADLDSLVIAGDAGHYVLQARLEPPHGTVRLVADWPHSPRELIGSLLPPDMPTGRRADLLALADTLDRGWPRDPSPRARFTIDVRDVPAALDALKKRDAGAAFAALDSLSLDGLAGSGRLHGHFAPPGGSLTLESGLGAHPRRMAGALLPLVTLPEHRPQLASLVDSISNYWPRDSAPHFAAGLYVRDIPAALAAAQLKRFDNAVALVDSADVRLKGGDYDVDAQLNQPRLSLSMSAEWPRPPRFLLSLLAERLAKPRAGTPKGEMAKATVATAKATEKATSATVKAPAVAAQATPQGLAHAAGAVADSARARATSAPQNWLALADSLARAWPTASPTTGPPHVHVTGGTDDVVALLSPERSGTFNVQADFLLPGPSTATALLPPQLDTHGWDVLGGTATAQLVKAGRDTSWTARLDLGGTPWINTGYIQARGRGHAFELQQLVFALPGFALQANAAMGGGHDRVTASFRMPDAQLLKRFRNPAFLSTEDSLSGKLSVEGPWTQPTGRFEVAGMVNALDVNVPRFEVKGATSKGPGGTTIAQVSLVLPKGAQYRGRHLKTAQIDVTAPVPVRGHGAAGAAGHATAAADTSVRYGSAGGGAHASPLSNLTFHAKLEGERSRFVAVGRIATGVVQTVQIDSLQVVMDNRDLSARRPFTISIDRARGGYKIQNVDLTGSMGQVRVDGDLTPESIDFKAELDWQLPLSSTHGLLPPDLVQKLPNGTFEGSLRIKAGGSPASPQADMQLAAGITGNKKYKDVKLTGTGSMQPSLTTARLEVDWSGTPGVTMDVRYPVRIAMRPFAFKPITDETIAVDIKTPGLDLKNLEPFLTSMKKLEGKLVVDVRLRGTGGAPPTIAGDVALQDAKGRTDNGSWVQTSGKITLAGTTARPEVKGSIDVYGGVIRLPDQPPKLLPVAGRARLWQTPVGGRIAETDSILAPGKAPLAGVGPSGTPGLASATGPTGTSLAQTGPTVHAATGGPSPAPSPTMGGPSKAVPKDTLRTTQVDTTRNPTGRREPGRPTGASEPRPTGPSGQNGQRYGRAGADTTGRARITAAKGAIMPQLDVEVSLPNGLLIHGYGADIDLRGKVTARTAQEIYFTLGGKLDMQRGTLQFLGRQFKLDSGSLTFHQDEVKIDPNLAVTMSTTLSGDSYTVEVTGTATHPKMALTSDPPMAESDIMSNLVFGRNMGQLDTGEQQYLSARAEQVAEAYGSAALSEQLSRAVGVDVLRLQNTSDTNDSRSLLVGKYISPRVLVQYEQVLTAKTAFYVHLEYLLSRFFSVDTTVGEGGSSGLNLNWSRDY